MNTQLNAYVAFDGQCREAMTFYQQCLGGTLEMQTVAKSPMAAHMPAEMQQNILHARLQRGSLLLLASDKMHPDPLVVGNAMSLMLNCSSETEVYDVYAKLSEGGTVQHPLETTFWGAIFGDLTDRFGMHWYFHFALETVPA